MIDLNSEFALWRQDLIKDPRLGDWRDDLDWNGGQFTEVPTRHIEVRHPDFGYIITQSECNLYAIKKYFKNLSNCKAILEIGVDHNIQPTDKSSTKIFLDNKTQETIYLGVDINDKSYITDHDKNIFTYQGDSSNIASVMNYATSIGIEKFDFIFIDGWHSINQVMKEWEYSRWLADGGIIGFHDTAVHPGPHLFLKYMDTNKWNVVQNSCGFKQNDFGVGFVWKKN